jgi:citronellol/citronellal dehydrogenase
MQPLLSGRTLIVTGASRGIGRSIALRCAADGANLVIAAKSDQPHPKLPGTIHSVAEEVRLAGGNALPVAVDVRSEEDVRRMVARTVETFGGIDALVNNAGAISLTSTEATPMKRYDLLQQINTRAVFLCSQACLPHLKKSPHAHILNLSPPISLDPRWLGPHLAYTISKYGMTLCTLGLAAELAADGIAVNSLWPRTIIDTAAVEMLVGEAGRIHARRPQIVAAAAYRILTTPPRELTGQTLLDDEVLLRDGEHDLAQYACAPGEELWPDLFVPRSVSHVSPTETRM